MAKIVINTCYGGFKLSERALDMYNELSDKNLIFSYNIERNDPILVHVVETLGELSSGYMARLRIVKIPDGVNWEIHKTDGYEVIHEVGRMWEYDGD